MHVPTQTLAPTYGSQQRSTTMTAPHRSSRVRVPALALAFSLALAGCATGSSTKDGPTSAPSTSSAATTGSPTSSPTASSGAVVDKLLVFVVENHSFDQMRRQMSYTRSIAD